MNKTFIVAEMSANHGKDLNLGIELIYAAKESGADAIKLQTYTPDTLTIRSDKKWFQIHGGLWDGQSLYDLYESAYTPWDWHWTFKEVADSIGIELFSTPFDITAVYFLEELGVQRYKVASFENRDAQLLKTIAMTGKPVIISSGMTSLDELRQIVGYWDFYRGGDLTLLKCTSSYPARTDESNVSLLPVMAQEFGCEVGVSDHTPGWYVPAAAVALGGTVVEKHLTLSRNINTPDSGFSMEPDEFADMVFHVREMEKVVSSSEFGVTEGEKDNIIFRRSLFVVEDVCAGDLITNYNVRSIRPGYGISPLVYFDVVNSGRKFNDSYDAGTPLSWDMME